MVVYALVATFLPVIWVLHRIFAIPAHLRHLPTVPLWPWVWSYLTAKPDSYRCQRFLLPMRDERGEGLIFHHILMNHGKFVKDYPDNDTMFIQLIGTHSVGLATGDDWKRQAPIVKQAFSLPVPIPAFVALVRSAIDVVKHTTTVTHDQGQGQEDAPTHTVRWSELAQRIALDGLGIGLIGHNFDAVRTRSSFVEDYNKLMPALASPPYVLFPRLERLLPRPEVRARMDRFVGSLVHLLHAKRDNPGDDIMTFLLNNKELSEVELRDNMVTLFIAGHDTTAGAMASFMYFLAKRPEIQQACRSEVLRVLGPTADPTQAILGPDSLPYLHACIHETMRINPPASFVVSRAAQTDVVLDRYLVPAGTPLVPNIHAMHHSARVWDEPEVFHPERFLDANGGAADLRAGATSSSSGGWMPFVTGPRKCPAQNFALYEMRTIAAMFLREFEWTLPKGSIHENGIQNSFFAFSLSMPYDLDITFRPLRQEGESGAA
ncbi:cytochrome P450 [Coniophora puteana RWD-64-598 SS2]|uniref:Cytochrome P450 n=1 Tax=Coniophora puteana (strain RWD-64-598) TaxID=741705 RepID=A0A5M3MDY7_CONPW|nr:cytochrome P450 [Coniophora puteana RWD-64-598 SS2]EIW76825.1 cytochrome P450 [Coniophora puteana RWD-64-598 SS2]